MADFVDGNLNLGAFFMLQCLFFLCEQFMLELNIKGIFYVSLLVFHLMFY